jgi:hypothetical protein
LQYYQGVADPVSRDPSEAEQSAGVEGAKREGTGFRDGVTFFPNTKLPSLGETVEFRGFTRFTFELGLTIS